MHAIGLPPFFSMSHGPIRPLAKTANYDNEFDKLLDELDIARREGLIDVISTYDTTPQNQLIIGSVEMGGYPLNTQFMLLCYRSVAREPDILSVALEGDDELFSLPDEQIAALGISDAAADIKINDDPHLPLIEANLRRDYLRTELTMISRGRIASVMKSIGYCTAKDLVPVFSHDNYNKLAAGFASRAADVIDKVANEDPYWARRRKVLELAHNEYLDEAVLGRMSIDEVIRLRSSVWGKQAEARDALLNSVAQLARDPSGDSTFEAAVREQITKYRGFASEVQKQRSSLSFKINCELAGALGSGAASLLAGSSLLGTLSHMQTAMGAGTILLAGCLWSVKKVQELKPPADQLRAFDEEFQDNICFGLHNFYHRMGNAVASNVRI